MDIQKKTVLVLGGWGLVGSAICRKLVELRPKRIIVTSLLESEAREAVQTLQHEFPHAGRSFFQPWWGNIFVRHSLKETPREEILRAAATRAMLIDDLLDEFSTEVLERSAVYRLLKKYRPEIVIDCINSATAIAYQDLFNIAREVRKELKTGKSASIQEATERLLATQYTPQLIRHVQLLYRSMQKVGTRIYVKIGTSGTGGMGLNIPYTHSEERPSSVLLGKSSVAGAHTMLLFLMGRTPDAPITKEIKPTAAIAWKRIGFGEIKKRGKPIELYDCLPENAVPLKNTLKLTDDSQKWTSLNQPLRSVFIDTGENGTFSRAEFEAISTPGQMEYVTPEEIAESVVYEIKGGNTGHDIINALDNATLNPTYRAGFMFEQALKQLRILEEKHNTKSIAFEILGPPRLSKLLYEAHLLQLTFEKMKGIPRATPKEMSAKLDACVRSNAELRSRIISIGIPILLSNGKTLLRAKEIKIPPYRGENELSITGKSLDAWAHDGWVDLRTKNMELWKHRFTRIMNDTELIPKGETSSRHFRSKGYWNNFEDIDPGKLAGWVFSEEEKGKRMKA
ncbi:MAG: polysaccharide biosynthesis protein [Ignavibacteriales bacterium]|nr:polysaccharide biosynthesis protein [Ignavibacteriales bacterium]